ncbi:MAG: hypothetical protein QM529_00375 [Hydrotalea sp.]|nr:hypothetical protein [Hydrotalea sp.]
MKKNIPDNDNVLRHIKGSWLDAEKNTVTSEAFMLREHEQGISVNWLEHDIIKYPNTKSQINFIRGSINLELKKSHRFLKLNVGKTKNIIKEKIKKTIIIEHQPNKHDNSHSCIAIEKNKIINKLIALCIVEEFGKKDNLIDAAS